MGIGIWKSVDTNDATALFDGIAIIVGIHLLWFKLQLFSSLWLSVPETTGENKISLDLLTIFQKACLVLKVRIVFNLQVIRSGKTLEIATGEILVGDVCMVETGDLIPADGLFISGFDMKCDESSLTGETDAAGKSHNSPFLVSGTKVLQGVCNILVIGTGINSLNGRILAELNIEPEDTPLQVQLRTLADKIAKIGVASVFSMIVIILTAYLSATGGVKEDMNDVTDDIINIFVTGVTVIVVAIPEGLPLAVTLALAHATLQMLKDNNLVRNLASCESNLFFSNIPSSYGECYNNLLR
jgi:P-type E1-E2 ATPase